MDNRGQGALEYLLLIGGAVLVAAVVLALLLGFAQTGQNTANTANQKFQHSFLHLGGLV